MICLKCQFFSVFILFINEPHLWLIDSGIVYEINEFSDVLKLSKDSQDHLKNLFTSSVISFNAFFRISIYLLKTKKGQCVPAQELAAWAELMLLSIII